MRASQFYALPLVLLLVKFKTITGCSLCLDGSTITNSDYVIGVTVQLGIADWTILLEEDAPVAPSYTCKDVSDALLDYSEDSYECLGARALSAFCGCPVAKNACSICESSQHIISPQQLLDGLKNFDEEFLYVGDSSIRLDSTCEISDSRLQVYNTGQAECLDPQIYDLCYNCGCSSSECTFCPSGEIVLDQSEVNTFNKIGKEDRVSCEQTKTLAAETEKGTEVCNQIKISTVCGCPVPEAEASVPEAQKRLFHAHFVWEETIILSRIKSYQESKGSFHFFVSTHVVLYREQHFYIPRTRRFAEEPEHLHSFAGVSLAPRTYAPYAQVVLQ